MPKRKRTKAVPVGPYSATVDSSDYSDEDKPDPKRRQIDELLAEMEPDPIADPVLRMARDGMVRRGLPPGVRRLREPFEWIMCGKGQRAVYELIDPEDKLRLLLFAPASKFLEGDASHDALEDAGWGATGFRCCGSELYVCGEWGFWFKEAKGCFTRRLWWDE